MRGDPTILGWLTTVGYLVASALALRAAGLRRADRRLMTFWAASALALLGLGLNKQLDLQIDLMRAGRAAVVALGLYPGHRLELMVAVAGLAVFGLAVSLGAVAWLVRGRWAQTRIAASGWALIAVFIALRAAAFHHLEELGLPLLTQAGGLLLELGGIALLTLASLRRAPEP